MNTHPQATNGQNAAKFKTTLYLTESNRRRLEQFSKGNRTQLINQAIAEKLEELERVERAAKLLDALENTLTTPANGMATEEVLHEIRAKELRGLVTNQ